MSSHSGYPRTRLYVEERLALHKQISLPEKTAHYLSHVLRSHPGDEVALFNGHDGEWRGTIHTVSKKHIDIDISEQLRPQQQTSDLWLLAAPLKHSKTEWVVEKATELGVSKIIPVTTQHTVVSRINEERLHSIAREAAEQCERLSIPTLSPTISFEQCLATWDTSRLLIYGDESGHSANAKEILPTLTTASCAILIGPEGGFSDQELALLRSVPFAKGLCMGPRILRADTAAIAAISLVQAWWGDWQDKPAFRK